MFKLCTRFVAKIFNETYKLDVEIFFAIFKVLITQSFKHIVGCVGLA